MANRFEPAVTSALPTALEALLQAPEGASTVPVPHHLHADILELFSAASDSAGYGRQELFTAQQLQAIRSSLADSPVCFYPFGGADAYYPMLLSNASVTVMTSVGRWGRLEDIGRAMDAKGAAGKAVAGASCGFDSIRDWDALSEDLGFAPETLGPLAVFRAIAAQALNGQRVSEVKVCGFDLAGDAGITYVKTTRGEAQDRHVAFWTTTADGTRKLHLSVRLFLPDEQRTSGRLHALLSRISGPRQTLMLEKAIPPRLVASEPARNLLSPPPALLKAIVCDSHMDHDTASQPVHAQGTWRQEAIKLKRLADLSDGPPPSFGYGDTVFVHLPAPAAEGDDGDAATNLRRVADRHRRPA